MSETFEIQPGSFLIIDISSARGGVSYRREHDPERKINHGQGAAQDIHTHKRVDHKVMVKDGNNLVQSDVRCVLRAHCSYTRLGWVAPKAALPAIADAFSHLEAKARAFNESAAIAGSRIHVTVGYVPVEITVDNVEAARYLARTVRDVCGDMIEALRAGDRKSLSNLARRAKNLDKLAVGTQRMSITFAVECFKEARGALNAAVKESGLKGEDRKADGSPKGRLAKHLATVGPKLDLEAIEACIDMFTELEDGADAVAA